MKRFMSDAFLGMMAVIAVLATMGTVFSVPLLNNQRVAVERSAPQIPPSPAVAVADCVPADDMGVSLVGGLEGVAVPGMPGMLRLDYDKSQYSARGSEQNVLEYYLPKLASECWKLTSLDSGAAAWEKGGTKLALAVQENGLGEKAVLSFSAEGNVLGVKVAQVESGCSSSQYYCPGSGCVPMGTSCSSSGGSGTGTGSTGSSGSSGSSGTPCPNAPSNCTNGYIYDSQGCFSACAAAPTVQCSSDYAQSGTYTCNYSKCPNGCSFGTNGCPNGCYASSGGGGGSCGSGNYWCNGACVPNGTACTDSSSGNTIYKACSGDQFSCNGVCVPTGTSCSMPGSGTTSCPSDKYWCNGACVPMGTSCSPSGGTNCQTGYYWCSDTNSCKPNADTNCTKTTDPAPTPTKATSCTGMYQRRGVEGPSCDVNTCSYGCTYAANGCPSGCLGATDQECAAGQKWCAATKTCKAVGETCEAVKRVCDPGFVECGITCIPDGSTCATAKPSCTSDQYLCNAACIPTSQSCNGYPYYKPGDGTTPDKKLEEKTNDRQQQGRQKDDMPRGPSEEDRKRMDEERLKQMKRNMGQFERGIKQMERMVKRMEPRLARAGVGIPQELKAALAKAPEAVAKIKAAKTAEELEDLMDDIQDIGESMQEWGPKFGDLDRLAKMLPRAAQDLKNMKRSVDRVAKGVKKMPSSEEAAAELKASFDAMSASLAEAKTLAATDAEAALQKLEADFYDKMEEFWNAVAEVDMLQNLAKGISQGQSELRRAESRIRSLERSKKITAETAAELREMLSGIKTHLSTVQALAKAKGADIDELRTAAETFWESVREFEERMADLGQSFYEPTIQRGESYNFELPEGFDFGSSGGGPSEEPRM